MSAHFVDNSQCTRKTPFPGVDLLVAAGEKMMLSLVDIEPGAVVEAHSHPHEQVGIVIEGRAKFEIDGVERVLGPGDMYTIPGDILHRVEALDEHVKALDVFHPIREEYLQP